MLGKMRAMLIFRENGVFHEGRCARITREGARRATFAQPVGGFAFEIRFTVVQCCGDQTTILDHPILHPEQPSADDRTIDDSDDRDRRLQGI